MLLLPEGQTGEAWERPKMQRSFPNWGTLVRGELPHFSVFKVLDPNIAYRCCLMSIFNFALVT
jgi:hypothetical protein